MLRKTRETESFTSSLFKKFLFNPSKTQCIGDSFHIINPKFTYENRTIKTKDDVNLRISLVIPKNISKETHFIILCHGSSVNRGFYSNMFDKYNILDENVCVLLLDYREYGNSEGIFSKTGAVYDLEACVKYFYKRFKTKFTFIGSSLGSAVILEYCKYIYLENKNVCFDKLVLLSCFTSVMDFLKESISWKFIKILPNQVNKITNLYDFNLLESIKYVGNHNVLILHGLNDKLVKISSAKRLASIIECKFDAFNEDHFNITFSYSVWKRIFEFLNNSQ
ncbi:hypothetical protein H311_04125 [Anncaliia algerae PRA109]|nr:hypothetical protein H311_04125 [Anncaliia algerae PRA109]